MRFPTGGWVDLTQRLGGRRTFGGYKFQWLTIHVSLRVGFWGRLDFAQIKPFGAFFVLSHCQKKRLF